ncbi:response regulator [Anaerocolumna xylanovorans]|uniref:Stage 0 sporulation protein A homolog n=1 Tax=Anaerocolumna xylanovorans DSM 12503 TaxID=1121345 RepID=A0A1M7Y6U0_9FIRM|nr:response regulator [Anaerocolumna xylanovorans]SHO48320.1 Two-component response regulator, SAPR family, consists of REC, wHTH and BTAD domains [Anaerocolumna xylanovorans DSM 12503]
MLRAIIVDDEKPAVEVLKLLLEKTGQICVVGSFMSAVHALSEVQNLKPDVAFLDIEMPEMSGLELAEKIIEAGNDIEIVFVTAYDKYALEAFRVNAINYILKPLSSDYISQTITRLKKIKPSPVSPQMPADKGRIYCFGRLLVYGAGYRQAVKWRTSKAEELFAFMLQNLNNEVSKWKITQALWPECETEKLNVNLYTTVYQVKKTLLSANIKFDFAFVNGRYKLELPEVYIDSAEFETITNTKIILSAASIERYKKVLSLYKGNYLDENEYRWSQSKVEEYSRRYCSLVFDFVKYYETGMDYANAEKILQEALTKVPLDDDLNGMLLKLFFIKKDKVSLVMHYNKIEKLYKAELGIAPNAAMQDLFNRAFKL